MTSRLTWFVLAVLIAACQAPAPDTAAPAPVVDDEAPTAAQASPWILAVEDGGLRLVNGNTGATRAVPFSTSPDDVLPMVTRMLGEPTIHRNVEPCNLHAASWPGLMLRYDDQSLAGWWLGADSEITDMAGIGVGSTVAEMREVYETEFQESDFGTLILAGGLVGIVPDQNPGSTIQFMYSGVPCV